MSEEATTEAQDTAVKDVESMSMEDMDYLLFDDPEGAGEVESKEEEEEEEAPPQEEPEATEPEEADTSTDEDESGETPEDEPETPEENTVSLSKDEWTKVQGRLEAQEKFIQRQGNEIGALRKDLTSMLDQRKLSPEEIAEQRERLKEAWENDPEGTFEALYAERRERERAEALQGEERHLGNKTTVREMVPDVEEFVPAIAEQFKRDGARDEDIETFRRDPYRLDPLILVAMARAAKAEQEVTRLAAENKKLSKSKTEIAKNITKAAQKKSTANVPNSGKDSQKRPALSPSAVSRLPQEKFTELEREMGLIT